MESTKEMTQGSVRFTMKALKSSSFTLLAIMMLGGSPIMVQVPPILEAIIWASTKGSGEIFKSFVSVKVIGTVSSTVVTLSSSAEQRATITEREISSATGLPFVF